MVQRMATSLFAKVPLLTGRDQHEAHFVLQMAILWPDLSDDDKQWVFQQLNVYCIIAALGWPPATAACESSTAVTDFVLPLGMAMQQPNQLQQRNRRENRNQRQPAAPGATAAAPAPPFSVITLRVFIFTLFLNISSLFHRPSAQWFSV